MEKVASASEALKSVLELLTCKEDSYFLTLLPIPDQKCLVNEQLEMYVASEHTHHQHEILPAEVDFPAASFLVAAPPLH
jgi:hypothetical protein